MYNQRSYRTEHPAALRDVIERYPFATVVSQREGEPYASHLPILWAPGGEHGTLVGHMARANPQWKSWDNTTRVLVIFHGPHSYISPAWYAQQVTVPTWNYVTVHAYGVPSLIQDTAQLRPMVVGLTERFESGGGWSVEQAAPIMDTELQAIVGFEIPIERLEGKFKLNQNRSEADQRGVVRALEQSSEQDQRAIAELMRQNLLRGKDPR